VNGGQLALDRGITAGDAHGTAPPCGHGQLSACTSRQKHHINIQPWGRRASPTRLEIAHVMASCRCWPGYSMPDTPPSYPTRTIAASSSRKPSVIPAGSTTMSGEAHEQVVIDIIHHVEYTAL
jgi:hypothetical protein